MEKLIVNSIDKDLENASLINGCQHSFMLKRLCQKSFRFSHVITSLMKVPCRHIEYPGFKKLFMPCWNSKEY